MQTVSPSHTHLCFMAAMAANPSQSPFRNPLIFVARRPWLRESTTHVTAMTAISVPHIQGEVTTCSSFS